MAASYRYRDQFKIERIAADSEEDSSENSAMRAMQLQYKPVEAKEIIDKY